MCVRACVRACMRACVKIVPNLLGFECSGREGFSQKFRQGLDGSGWVGGVSYIKVFFQNFFNFAKLKT